MPETTETLSSPAQRAADAKAQREAFARLERTTGNSGAVPLTPKAMMLDVRDLQRKDPEHHYRWVSTKDSTKIEGRIVEGYSKVAEGDGGRTLGGSLILMKIPRRAHDARIARQNKLTNDQLNMHKHEMERLAEGMARTLRDRHGIDVTADRLLEIGKE